MSKRSRFFTSRNPLLTEERFQNAAAINVGPIGVEREETMTVKGAVNKSFILAGLLLASAFVAAYFMNPIFIWVGLAGGLISLLVAMFKPTTAAITAPLYAIFEGLLLGTISMMFAKALGAGVVINSVLLTLLALAVMLFAYRTGLIKPTEKFRSIIVTATGAIAVLYLVNLGLQMFGFGAVPYLHEMSPLGIGISLFIIAIASLNLILDFDSFDRGEEAKAPVYMEWIAALGLMVTLVWLYLEILRLVSMFSGD